LIKILQLSIIFVLLRIRNIQKIMQNFILTIDHPTISWLLDFQTNDEQVNGPLYLLNLMLFQE